MRLNSDKYEELSFVVGDAQIIEEMQMTKPMAPFADEVIAFLNDLSRLVLKTGSGYSDVATFGFWCRRSALLNEKKKYDDLGSRQGRGTVFHSTPSNVPVNFAFSFAAGLLAGNANIVRLPAKNFDQVKVICEAINSLLEETHKNIKPYIAMVKYPPVQEISDYFSAVCDTRIVWGGDATINELRCSPLKPRATEINFADRHSIAVVNADRYIELSDVERAKLAQAFYNDTYFSDQNACTSPRIIIWLGNDKKEARDKFWKMVTALAKDKYTLAPVHSVGKLTAFYRTAAKKKVHLHKTDDMYVTRVEVDDLDEGLMDYKYNSGFFFEYDAEELEEIMPLCTERCQTLTYFGVEREEFEKFIETCRPRGVDRIVPMGKSMDFSLIWDGFDLVRGLSRITLILR